MNFSVVGRWSNKTDFDLQFSINTFLNEQIVIGQQNYNSQTKWKFDEQNEKKNKNYIVTQRSDYYYTDRRATAKKPKKKESFTETRERTHNTGLLSGEYTCPTRAR